MPRATPVLTNFNGGEWHPELWGSFDLEKYGTALRVSQNFIGQVRRAARRRGGTRYITPTAADGSGQEQIALLIDFVFSVVQAYVIEATALKFRFIKDRALILGAGAELIANAKFDANIASWTDISLAGGVIAWDSTYGGSMKFTKPGGIGSDARAQQNVTGLTPGAFTLSISHVGHTFRVTLSLNADLSGEFFNTGLLPDAPDPMTYAVTVPAASIYVNIIYPNPIASSGWVKDISLTSAPAPVAVVTPYGETELPALKWTQSADVLYLVHGAHRPQTLTRSSHINWTLANFGNIDGPYGEQNVTSATLTPSATTGDGITITAGPAKAITGAANNGVGLIRITSAAHKWTTGMRLRVTAVGGTVEANGIWTVTRIDNNHYDLQGSTFVNAYTAGGTASPAIFAASDIGRLVRIKNGATWGYAEIVGFTSESVVTADVRSDFAAATANAAWRLGAWSDGEGWPTAVAFFDERLWFARNQTLWGSRSGDFLAFSPTEPDNTVVDDDAVSFTIADNEVNEIRALVPGDALTAITNSGPFIIQASALNEAITPTNIKAVRAGTIGAANQMAQRINQATLIVERSTAQLYQLTYRFDLGVNGAYQMDELTELARHISRAGIVATAWQQNPHKVLYAARADGVLLGMTYAPSQNVLGWHPHPIAGRSVDAASVTRSFGKVLSIAVIPGAVQDELWLVVERIINGATRRYVEVIENEFAPRTIDDKDMAWFVDAALAFDGAQGTTLTPGAGAGTVGQTDVVFTAGASLFGGAGIVGKELHYPYDVQIGDTLRTKRARALITSVDSPTTVRATIAVAFPAAPAILPASSWRLTASHISGLDHLEGETVQILADGSVHATRVVAAGAIDLDRQAGRVQVGLGYTSRLETLNLEGLAALAGQKRIAKAAIMFNDTLAAKFGGAGTSLDTIPFRAVADPIGESPPLFRGSKPLTFPGGFEQEARAIVVQDQPLPCTVVAIGLDLEANSG